MSGFVLSSICSFFSWCVVIRMLHGFRHEKERWSTLGSSLGLSRRSCELSRAEELSFGSS